ncbi:MULTISPECIES: glutamate-5-semialdehyde dehydrogenase [unclassified Aerococcus]|uniref:glutamate-5-semialdehyde dehydrogenase n=1 Tax=unclassified Aerococcus TaxID=2618060 RepID=UPI0025C0E423|nr:MULTISPECIES: glutamate-5-semialdehyde dehydrogenase [unclassified Aerococcus]
MIDAQGLLALGKAAKLASRELGKLPSQQKNAALLAMAKSLRAKQAAILAANQADIENTREAGRRPESFIERMTLTESRIDDMAAGFEKVANLPDIIGQTDEMWFTEDGIEIGKKRVPLGVIGIIFESRPNVTADATALTFKAGNAVILRGGSETIQSNLAIIEAIKAGLSEAGVTTDAVNLIDNPDRDLATQFMQMNQYLDVLIPRGGAALIQNVVKSATVPTIETGIGNDHLYVHEAADLDKALDILKNGKLQRVSVCNALENLLVDEKVAEAFLPQIVESFKADKVVVHGDQRTQEILQGKIEILPVSDEDYATEFLAYEIAVKVTSGYDEAIEHIQTYSSAHTEVIVTQDYSVARQFVDDIDAAAVVVNASSRFTDGDKFGFGGEIGISTQKLHARGPMGIEALTTYKYVIYGDGQIRQ